MSLAIAAAVLGGLLLGWFANVVAYRLPRGEPLLSPGLHRERISGRDALTIALTAGLLAAVVSMHHDRVAQLVLGLVLVAFLVPLTLIDLDTRTLPDRLTAPAAVLGLALATALDPGREIERLIAAAAAGGFFLVAWYLRPGGMGFGDVKLVAVLGLFLGREVVVALLVALVAGVLVGVAIMHRMGVAGGRKENVPFGPFLALGGVVAVLAGGPLLDAYLELS